MTYQPQAGDEAFAAVSSNGTATLTTGYLSAGGVWMPTAGPVIYGENAAGEPTVVSTDNSGNLNVNIVSGGGISGSGTVAAVQAPLPASGVAPLVGTFTAAAQISTSFVPQAGRPFNVSGYATGGSALNAPLGGTVYLQKSVDGGATFQPVTAGGSAFAVYNSVFSEPLVETVVGTQYQLVCSAFTGTQPINYRFAQ